ncbi:tripartite tricarboxylate transporter substrate binding protein [Limimaricola litoreus]|uniref:Tripartite tricarboxylate transporter substrate binding protein n=1 Tax=Limimaricola litoreus TaxID=2955316 RepID=A0A9X2JRP3_9RHOB|nr:tripartite tricarboxylate transporter substrate binding protein [Limimaricola litoreus]MCP1170655.1 tripartite tricarboxylate transporter substrate binding protein [Limimaricola litoreus]
MKSIFVGALAALAAAATPVMAEYPEKEIRGIIQWGAGGSTDTVMRAVTPHAEDALGGKVVMQNMTGGVGAIAVKFASAQDADGYTLLMGAENPLLYKVMGLGETDYSSFTPINLLARGVPILVADTDAPFDTLEEMVTHVQENPGSVKFGSTGPGGLASVVVAMLQSEMELPVTSVPYDGDGPALTALQGGAIDVMPAVLGAAIEGIRAGRMKPIALIDVSPNEALPDLAPITKTYPAFETYLPWGPFFGVFVKEGTPDEVVTKLTEAYSAGVENEAFQQLMEDRGFEVMNISGAQAQDFLDKWQSVTSWLVHDAGIAKTSPEEFGIPRPE